MIEDPIILDDLIADSFIKSPTKNTLHFHHVQTNSDLFETLVYSNNYSNDNDVKHSAFNYIFIQDSEHYHLLFEAIGTPILGYCFEKNIFPGLTMHLLNDVLKK